MVELVNSPGSDPPFGTPTVRVVPDDHEAVKAFAGVKSTYRGCPALERLGGFS